MISKYKIPQIRFKDFGAVWEEKKFDDVIDDLYNGQTPSRVINSYWNGQINWLSSGELNRSIVTKAIEKITPAGQKNANLRIVPKGTFVMAITGLEATGTRGNCGILGIDTTLNQSCMAIYPNFKQLLTPFLFQWYRRNSEEYGLKFTQGTKQQSYNAEIIKKLDIVLPKVEEQTKIGNYFQQLDILIEQKEKKYQKLKQFKKAMIDKMFPKNGDVTPEIRFKGFSGKWEEKRLIDEVDLYRGLTYSPINIVKNKGTLVLRSSNVKGNRLVFEDNVYVNSNVVNSDNVEVGDIIVVVRNGSRSLIGKHAQVKKKMHNTVIGAFMTGMHCKQSSFINSLLDTTKFNKEIEKNLGATINQITNKAFEEMIFMFPIPEEQEKIGNYFQKLDKQIDLQLQEIKKLKNIKKASLDKMFV